MIKQGRPKGAGVVGVSKKGNLQHQKVFTNLEVLNTEKINTILSWIENTSMLGNGEGVNNK